MIGQEELHGLELKKMLRDFEPEVGRAVSTKQHDR
jgi:hypothetical protein